MTDKFSIKPHKNNHVSKLNWLRAAVLGANDGIVSIAGLVLGVAGASADEKTVFTAGIAGILAGSISMGVGEYISVSSSKDVEKALLEREKDRLKNYAQEELEELISIYERKGLSRKTSEIVAEELTAFDPLKAHFDAELGIDPNNLTNPWHAAIASSLSFIAGAIIPFIAILIPPTGIKIQVSFLAVILALVLTGALSAGAGGANKLKAVIRVVMGGVLAMIVTYIIGRVFGTAF